MSVPTELGVKTVPPDQRDPKDKAADFWLSCKVTRTRSNVDVVVTTRFQLPGDWSAVEEREERKQKTSKGRSGPGTLRVDIREAGEVLQVFLPVVRHSGCALEEEVLGELPRTVCQVPL
jgi:hypothetical protein